ncbi:MAG: hypothetical protein GEU77_00435 [Deltaproteobacteria bacterium]|nr:hypothetical protein [Deltaproteobacteria bacterium]
MNWDLMSYFPQFSGPDMRQFDVLTLAHESGNAYYGAIMREIQLMVAAYFIDLSRTPSTLASRF